MTAARDLLDTLHARGVTVQPVGDRLRYRGPSNALTADVLDALRRNKIEVLRLLAPHQRCSDCGRQTNESISMCSDCETREVRYHALGVALIPCAACGRKMVRTHAMSVCLHCGVEAITAHASIQS